MSHGSLQAIGSVIDKSMFRARRICFDMEDIKFQE